ncbi:MAG: transglutaminase-like domain-containing protein [Candidatus Ranarchaeia archaeon]
MKLKSPKRADLLKNIRASDPTDSSVDPPVEDPYDIYGTEQPRTNNRLYALLLIAIITLSGTIAILSLNLAPLTLLEKGETSAVLFEGSSNSYTFTLTEPTSIHLAIRFDRANDFDLYILSNTDLGDPTQIALHRSDEFLSIGEKIMLVTTPLPAGIYRVVVVAYRGSGNYTLFAAWPISESIEGTQWASETGTYIINGTSEIAADNQKYWAVYLPMGWEMQVDLQDLSETSTLRIIDGYGNTLKSSTGGASKFLAINASELFTYSAWEPTSWVLLEVTSTGSNESFSLVMTIANDLQKWLYLANATTTGGSLEYRLEYEYTLEVPNNQTLTMIRDAVPGVGNFSPYFQSQLVQVQDVSTGENLTLDQFVPIWGKDSLPWIGFTLYNVSGITTLRFSFDIVDEYVQWDQFDPNATIDDIPADILEIWTRNVTHYNVNEIPTGDHLFTSIVDLVLDGSENLAEKIEKLYTYTVRNIAYSINNPSGGAGAVIQAGRGNCHGYSIVLITLLRTAGIPAREGAGIGVQKQGSTYYEGYHGWVEVYYPNYGWVPIDPTWVDTIYGNIGAVGTLPAEWWESFQIAGSHLKLTSLLQANGSVWFSVGWQLDYLGSPYPEEWFTFNTLDQQMGLPEISRGLTIVCTDST